MKSNKLENFKNGWKYLGVYTKDAVKEFMLMSDAIHTFKIYSIYPQPKHVKLYSVFVKCI